jgi:SET domain-containing protein
METTNEFSFILKPAEHGVGVFAVHDIKKGTHLRLFVDEKTTEHEARVLRKTDVPETFQGHCLERGETMICPPDFGALPIGWYVNHSTTPNTAPGKNPNKHRRYRWYAIRDIIAGEEILIDYNDLEEPGKYFYNS